MKEEAKGFKAIVAQHEYDHLNGVLIAGKVVLGSGLETFCGDVSVLRV